MDEIGFPPVPGHIAELLGLDEDHPEPTNQHAAGEQAETPPARRETEGASTVGSDRG
jgi:hypothetical protein